MHMMENKLLEELATAIEGQKTKLLAIGAKKVSPFTEEELYQPFDFPALSNDPEFLYEEGVYHGLMASLALLRRSISESDALS